MAVIDLIKMTISVWTTSVFFFFLVIPIRSFIHKKCNFAVLRYQVESLVLELRVREIVI